MVTLIPNSNGEDAAPVRLQEFNDCHTPAGSPAGGQFCSKDGKGERARPVPVRVKSIDEAVSLILRGKVVELADVKQVSTVLTKLAAIAKDAEAKGAKAPHYDLCNVTVPGTNLFCSERVVNRDYPTGIERIEMPQFSGTPVPGSPADKLPKDKKGGVNGAADFMVHLERLGIKAERGTVRAASLKASQKELVGPKVASMMAGKSTEKLLQSAIFASRDNYVIDGHHRWAAIVGKDSEDGRLDIAMPVIRVDAPITEVLYLAKAWAKKFGISAKAGK